MAEYIENLMALNENEGGNGEICDMQLFIMSLKLHNMKMLVQNRI